MRFRNLILVVVSVLLISHSLMSQESGSQYYNECVAIFFNGQMLVDEYSPQGVCKISSSEKGRLTLHTVSLTDSSVKAISTIPFRVAIKNGETGTIWMYSDQSLTSESLHDIVKECADGDSILILTEDKKYALPHNEISLVWNNEDGN